MKIPLTNYILFVRLSIGHLTSEEKKIDFLGCYPRQTAAYILYKDSLYIILHREYKLFGPYALVCLSGYN